GLMYRTDSLMQRLSDSTLMGDSAAYANALSAALAANGNIPTGLLQEDNEKTVNNWYLKLLAYGLDSLQSDFAAIETMAQSCPWIEGSAVFKARMLYAVLGYKVEVPDIELCAPATRGSVSRMQQENNILNGLKQPMVKAEEEQIIVYPNPNEGTFSIKCALPEGETGYAELWDVNGRKVQKVTLQNGNTPVNITTVAPGIYYYRVLVNNSVRSKGALTIKRNTP